ncbi:MAG TPA: toast rack family protein [Caldisericia bacterium]|nr:toast rack family protein [Caldisericia bacterium]HPF48300.1 toast rack family protein [Caldisericia bacterium]HPI83521.1 toast rack family protein [Caldisericia bacterium]HPQ92753.1 toast rack family protein [Caldisericia bacterium]HRV74149.1 toast rack family protein [Caldisericia bacterium]
MSDTKTETIVREGEISLQTHIKFGAGNLAINGCDSGTIMVASYDCNLPELEPCTRYEKNGDNGRLTISQLSYVSINMISGHRNDWNIGLCNNIPLSLKVDMGVGSMKLNGDDMLFDDLVVNVGVGDVEINLQNIKRNNMELTVNGGVGKARIKLPNDVGVKAKIAGGIGTIVANGLKKGDGYYTNEKHETSDNSIKVTVQGGVGEITIDTL